MHEHINSCRLKIPRHQTVMVDFENAAMNMDTIKYEYLEAE